MHRVYHLICLAQTVSEQKGQTLDREHEKQIPLPHHKKDNNSNQTCKQAGNCWPAGKTQSAWHVFFSKFRRLACFVSPLPSIFLDPIYTSAYYTVACVDRSLFSENSRKLDDSVTHRIQHRNFSGKIIIHPRTCFMKSREIDTCQSSLIINYPQWIGM